MSARAQTTPTTRRTALNKLLTLTLGALPLLATAHAGHGLPTASHWHATDTAGLLLVLGIAIGLYLLSRRK